MPVPIVVGGGILVSLLSAAYIAGLIVRVLAVLGVGYFAFSGLDQGIDILQSSINNSLGGLSFDVKSLLDMSGITTVITWIINAHAFKIFINISGKVMFMRSSTTV